MVIADLLIDFELPFVFSLKERRKILNSIKSKIKKFNVSILDISGEYPKEASLAVCYLAHDTKQAEEIYKSIEKFFERNFPEFEFFIDKEII